MTSEISIIEFNSCLWNAARVGRKHNFTTTMNKLLYVDNFLRPSMRRFVRHGPECLGGSVMSQALTSADIAQQTSGSRSSPDVRPGAGPLLSPLYHRIIRCVDTSLPVWARTPLMC